METLVLGLIMLGAGILVQVPALVIYYNMHKKEVKRVVKKLTAEQEKAKKELENFGI